MGAPEPVGRNTFDPATPSSAVFYGSLDRYDFKLVGKREMYIPYNNYRIRDRNACPAAKAMSKHHLNPDCVRWELHRVWEVKATLKPGKRHVYLRDADGTLHPAARRSLDGGLGLGCVVFRRLERGRRVWWAPSPWGGWRCGEGGRRRSG